MMRCHLHLTRAIILLLSVPACTTRQQDARLMCRSSCNKNSPAGAAFTWPRAADKSWLRDNVASGYSTRLAS
eukprot:COSAG01_NODE_48_length_31904_cov_21.696997_16_plen_72_part_00